MAALSATGAAPTARPASTTGDASTAGPPSTAGAARNPTGARPWS
jgi:hypothetical protein